MKWRPPALPDDLSPGEARLLIELIDALIEALLNLQRRLYRTYFPADPDAYAYRWHTDIPF